MQPAGIITIDQNGAGDTDKIAPEKLVSGQAATKIWNAFSDTSGKFHVGHWASGPCKLKVSYSENELCVLLTGHAVIEDATGARAEYGPGEPFVIAAGFNGTWESLGDVTKIYAIYEA